MPRSRSLALGSARSGPLPRHSHRLSRKAIRASGGRRQTEPTDGATVRSGAVEGPLLDGHAGVEVHLGRLKRLVTKPE